MRQELHAFGFRPDLSRRSPESRIGREQFRPAVDSVALDIAERANAFNPEDEPRSQYTMAALPSFHFFAHAFTASEPMADHILVKCAYDWGDCVPEIIASSLRAVYRVACDRWGGAEQTWHAAYMVRLNRYVGFAFAIIALTVSCFFVQTDFQNACCGSRRVTGTTHCRDYGMRQQDAPKQPTRHWAIDCTARGRIC